MKKGLRRMGLLILVPVFVISTLLLLKQWYYGSSGSSSYEEALKVASGLPKNPEPAEAPEEDKMPQTLWIPAPVEGDPEMEAMTRISLEALREENPQVTGWIRIPGTRIDYPLMQGEDNDYYLNHTWNAQENPLGAIFLEYRNSPDLTDYNTIVYGHNMNDGSMFGNLRKYASEYHWKNNPYIYLATDAGVWRYEIFAAYRAKVDSATYGLSFHQETTRASFLIHALDSSVIQTKVVPEANDRILTLSTCSGIGYSSRWVVQARLKMIQTEEAA